MTGNHKIIQVYFDEKSEKNCYYPLWDKYFNATTTPFFENKIIEKFIDYEAHRVRPDIEYFGVFSHQFRYKIWIDRKRRQITPDVLQEWVNELKGHYQVISFFRSNEKNTKHFFKYADRVHKNNFLEPFKLLIDLLGFPFEENMRAKAFIHQNHFLATPDIYEDYVERLLAPAMSLMDSDKDLCKLVWEDSGYKRSKGLPERLIRDLTAYHRNVTGRYKRIDYYPMHTFICERLFSYYLTALNTNVKHYHI